MKGWLANVLREEIASSHKIFQKSAEKTCSCVCVCVQKHVREGGEDGWPLENWCLSASKP